jgi:transcriptional regulator with XRE-family HTH domain
MGYGYLLKQARKERGWTITVAAERLELGRSYYAHLESDRINVLRPEVLERIERVLGVSREEIARAAGLIGPPPAADVYDEIKRLADLASDEDRYAALLRLPPDVFQAIEVLAVSLVRAASRQAHRS